MSAGLDRDALAEAAMLFDPAEQAGRARLSGLLAAAMADATLGADARRAAAEAATLLAGPPADDQVGRLAVLADRILAEAAPVAQPVSSAVLAEFLARAASEVEELAGQVLAWSHGDGEARSELRRRFHTLKGDAGMLGLGDLQAVCHAAEEALVGRDPPTDCLLAVCDWIGLEVTHLAGGPAPERGCEEMCSLFVRLGELERQPASAAGLATQATAPPRRIGEDPDGSGAAHEREVASALANQRGDLHLVPATMRVEVERVDQLADAIGELAIAQAMLEGALGRVDRRTATLLGRMERLLRTAQDHADRLRMVPVRPAFHRAERAAREAATRIGKAVEVAVSGVATELDKAVVERLADPLLHLVRNAVVHGIETDAARRAAGKPAAGLIRLSAERREGRVEIAVADDGCGLDRARILATARAKGLPLPPDDAADQAVWDLLFLPGFTTSERVSELSGRGVGLDVVRSAVADLRGRITVTTTAGAGTTFTLVLPPTLAAVDGLVVSAAGQRFVIPTSSVRACVRPRPSDLLSAAGRGRLLPHQGHMLPWRPLTELLGLGGSATARPQAVVIGDVGRMAAIAVDQILGRTQAILKPVAGLPETPGIAGAAIGADGHVELVLDPEALLASTSTLPQRDAS